jgi:hypothetical protein
VAVSTYLVKVAYEAVATPLTYRPVAWLKQREGVDYYDRDTNFNPFAVRELRNGEIEELRNENGRHGKQPSLAR